MADNLENLRKQLDAINGEILSSLLKRFSVVEKIYNEKKLTHHDFYDPFREKSTLDQIIMENKGRVNEKALVNIFKTIFEESLRYQNNKQTKELLIKNAKMDCASLGLKNLLEETFFIAGPCSIESQEQMQETLSFLSKYSQVKFIRGGAFKPRTNPYAFQGNGVEGLKILSNVSKNYNFKIISEVMSPEQISIMHEYCDVFQVGSRNMYNYELLKELGKQKKPILLKRGFMATFEEFLLSAEYIAKEGNSNIIFCERGIRTFEKETRNTLDISSVVLLKQETQLPVVVDVSHAAGRIDILLGLTKASIAAGANGIMMEVHPNPMAALSDREQQLNFPQFENLISKL